jgi:hypothetical protein
MIKREKNNRNNKSNAINYNSKNKKIERDMSSTNMTTRSAKNYSNDIVNEDIENTSKKESNVTMMENNEVTPVKI